MASIANDKAMIHELMEGEKDLHTLTAKMVYPEIPKDMSASEVKKHFHDLRQKAKGYESITKLYLLTIFNILNLAN